MRKSRTERGACHLCGWTTELTHMSFSERRSLHLTSGSSRVCDDCLTTLVAGSTGSSRRGAVARLPLADTSPSGFHHRRPA
jgi:hypothetical protein